jgi:chorismate mutase
MESGEKYKLKIKELYSGNKPFIIAGPCSAESEEQLLETAVELSNAGVKILRAGIWKPRTRPGGFEGAGSRALKWLSSAKKHTGMLTATEVAKPSHVREAVEAQTDILWLGARTTTNPFAVQDIADELRRLLDNNPYLKNSLVVLVKNPVTPDPDLWQGAIERVLNSGITQTGAIHRGFSSYEKGLFRNLPHWHIPIELKRRMPYLDMICDPSHLGGSRELIYPISQQALDIGFDGLMIESHICPDNALSDSLQQITPEALSRILEAVTIRSTSDTGNTLIELRRQIDELDDRILTLLSERMSVSREIGRYKKTNNIPVLQPLRYNKMVTARLSSSSSLMVDQEFIKTVLEAIHQESVRQQIIIFNKKDNNHI